MNALCAVTASYIFVKEAECVMCSIYHPFIVSHPYVCPFKSLTIFEAMESYKNSTVIFNFNVVLN